MRRLPLDFRHQYFGCEIELTGINRATAAQTLADLFGTCAEHSGGGYDKFYLEHISCKWEWDYLRESIREETPQPRQGKLSPDIASTLPILWKKRLAWDAEQRTRPSYRGEER